MIPAVEIAGARVFLGDCRDVLATLPDNSVDSIVTDPPYELGFMGKKWDNSGIAYDVTVWQECLRVLKPGGHILAFGGSRTWHRLAVAVEDAGFELRDSIAWIYGSGFPKSLDVSKAIDKRAGAERKVIGPYRDAKRKPNGSASKFSVGLSTKPASEMFETEPATSEAQKWQGWGTALKPAFEPVVVGRKPLVGTVAENVLTWGVGGLNIDGSRIGSEKRPTGLKKDGSRSQKVSEGWDRPWKNDERADRVVGDGGAVTDQGRWPANVILDEVTAGLLDEQSGVSKTGDVKPYKRKTVDPVASFVAGQSRQTSFHKGDSGGASRFFYVAKASKRDRNEGLEELEARIGENGNKWTDQDYRRGDEAPVTARKNFHPTVKPTQLMRYLIKLVTPEGGVVLDPFTGSGSTGKAALLDGYQFIGAELTEEYLPIIEGRLRWASEQEGETDDTLF